MGFKKCGMCKIEKPVSEFCKSKRDGYQSRCKDCFRVTNRERNREPSRRAYNKMHYERLKASGYYSEYSQKPEVKVRQAKNMLRLSKKPDYIFKNAARRMVKTCKKNGTLIQQPCSSCGKSETQAHHTDYSKPLLVVWLCPDCHRKEHVKLNAKAKGESE